MGFQKLILGFVLFQVYGMDGWPFIEEASYRVLLDNMLEKVEEEEKKKVKLLFDCFYIPSIIDFLMFLLGGFVM